MSHWFQEPHTLVLEDVPVILMHRPPGEPLRYESSSSPW